MAGKGEVVTGFMAGEYALPQEEREFRKAVASAKRERKAVIDQALKSKNYQLTRSIKEAKAKGQPYSIEASADPAAHNEILKQERIKAGTWRTSPFLTQDSSSPAPTKSKSKKVPPSRAHLLAEMETSLPSAEEAQKAAGYDKMSRQEKTQWWIKRGADIYQELLEKDPPPGPKGKKAQKRDSLTKSTTSGDKPMAKSKKNAASTTPTDGNSTPPAVAAATAKADDAVEAKSATKKPAAKKPATKKPAAKKPAAPKDASKKPSAITRADGPRNFGANKRGDGGYNDDVKRYSEAMGREKELVGGASKPELKPLTPSDGGAPKDSSTPAQQPAAPAQSQPAKPGFASRIRGMFGGRGKKQAPSAGAPATPAAAPAAASGVTMNSGNTAYSNSGNVSVGNITTTGSDFRGAFRGGNPYQQHNQNISGGGPVTATTSGRAQRFSSGKDGVVASTTGNAAQGHPRSKNAARGGRPTTRKK